jgi:hypothetical protein
VVKCAENSGFLNGVISGNERPVAVLLWKDEAVRGRQDQGSCASVGGCERPKIRPDTPYAHTSRGFGYIQGSSTSLTSTLPSPPAYSSRARSARNTLRCCYRNGSLRTSPETTSASPPTPPSALEIVRSCQETMAAPKDNRTPGVEGSTRLSRPGRGGDAPGKGGLCQRGSHTIRQKSAGFRVCRLLPSERHQESGQRRGMQDLSRMYSRGGLTVATNGPGPAVGCRALLSLIPHRPRGTGAASELLEHRNRIAEQ